MTDPSAMLELRGVSVSYGKTDRSGNRNVLSGVSLGCPPGQLTCVQGRSGSGKTTLLNVAAGMLAPSAGEVLWGEEPIWKRDERWRRSERRRLMGYVMQGGGLIDSLTAAENVGLSRIPVGTNESARRRALELLDSLEIGPLSNRFPFELSGGEQQRVALARALFADPQILIIDEPTASLDRRTADGVIELIANLASQGHAVVVASHDDHVIERATSRLVLA